MRKLLSIILISSIALTISAAVFIFNPKEAENNLDSDTINATTSAKLTNENHSATEEGEDRTSSNDTNILANLAQAQPLKGEKKGQTNILILGSSGAPHPSPKLTDSILIAMLDFDEKKLRAISIPRDLIVKNEQGRFQKINSIYRNNLKKGKTVALKKTKSVCERITGLDIHYSLKINLGSVKTVVNELGGINIEVTEDIYDPAYPGPNYTYEEFKLKKGWRYLNGEQAVKFIRSRHSPRGDFDRIKRQKALLAAIYLKINKMGPIEKFRKVLSLRKRLEEEINTDLGLAQLKRLYFHKDKFDLEDLKVYQLNTRGENSLLRSTHMELRGQRLYVLLPEAGTTDYAEIHNYFKNKF